MSQRKANLLLSFGAVLFCLLATEVMLRVIDAPIAMPFAIRHPVADRFQMPNRDVDIALPVDNPEFLAHATTNSIGMLDIEYPLQKPKGILRGALLGDSFCAAVEVPQRENFHTLIENDPDFKINGKRVELLNFGVRAIGLTQQLQLYRLFAQQFKPDFVLLSVYLSNDLTDNQVFYRKGFPDPLIANSYLHPPLFWRIEYFWRRFNFFLSEHTKLYPFILVRWKIVEQKINAWYHKKISPLKGSDISPHVVAEKKREQLEPQNIKESKGESMPQPMPASSMPNLFNLSHPSREEELFVQQFLAKYDSYAKAEAKMQDSEKQAYHAKLIESEPMIVELLLLKALKNELDAEGVKMLLFVFNSKYELDALKNAPETVQQKWLPLYRILFAFCKREGISAYNLMEDFAKDIDSGKQNFFKTDDHWNVKGQHYVASRLEPFLKKALTTTE